MRQARTNPMYFPGIQQSTLECMARLGDVQAQDEIERRSMAFASGLDKLSRVIGAPKQEIIKEGGV